MLAGRHDMRAPEVALAVAVDIADEAEHVIGAEIRHSAHRVPTGGLGSTAVCMLLLIA